MGRDPIKKPKKLQAITKAKGALQAILLLSILSFLLSNYSSCLHYINVSSTNSTFLNKLDYFINRKAIFLFFNVILLFLVKDSGLLSHCSSPVLNKPYDEFLATRKGDHRSPLKAEAMEIEADVYSKATTASGQSLELVMTEGRRDERKTAEGMKAHVVEEKAVVESGQALELVLIGGGDEDAMKDVDIDELNRKFDEFIEKVKRQRRMETLQVVML